MSASSTRKLTVLLLGGRDAETPELLGWFRERATIQTAESFEEAMRILRDTSVDLVVSSADRFLPFETHHMSQHADALIESMTQGLAIVDRDGSLVWANPRMLAFPEEVRERVSAFCVEAFALAASRGDGDFGQHAARINSFEHHNESYELSATPVIDLNSKVTRVAAVVWTQTRTRKLQERIDAIDRAADELVSLDAEQVSRLDVQQRLDLLEQKVIRYTRELLHFDNFTVHILDRKTNKLELVLSAGMPQKVSEIPIYANPEGNGVCGWVAANGRSYICPDVTQDVRYISGIEGAKSSLTVPLKLHDRVIGVFNVESKKLAAFTEDDRQFAEIFARHIAMALHILDLLVSEQHKTTGRLASDVMSEITGPLNDMLTDIGNLVDDYIGHDELRHRLNRISDNAVKVRDAIRRMSARKPGLADRHRAAAGTVRHDPVLEGRAILVADDEEVIRETVSDVLRSYGCKVESARDGEAAVKLIEAGQFDLVLSDIRMPGRDGYQVFAAAKDRDRECPVILMTGFGYDPNHSIVRARREGLAAVLFKPFKVEQLLGEIRTAIKSTKKRG